MRKFWFCVLATILFCVWTLTAAACNFAGMMGGMSSSTESSMEASAESSSSWGGVTDSSFLEEVSSESGLEEESSVDNSAVVLRFTQKTYDIEVGQNVALQIEFTLDGEPADLSILRFSSNNPAVATVSEDGTLTGVASGATSIRAWYGNNLTTATINVIARENRLEISNDRAMLLVGEETQITATAYCGWTEITDATLLWESADTSVATVENGMIKAVGYGKTKITVSYEDVTAIVSVAVIAETTAENVNTFDEEYVNIYGRCYVAGEGLTIYHAASGVEVGIIGTSLKATVYSTKDSYMRVFVDNLPTGERIALSAGEKEYTVASGLEEGRHTVRIVKCTEESNAYWIVKAFSADKFFQMSEKSNLKIEFIGDSITAGHGSRGGAGEAHTIDNSDAAKTSAYLTAHALEADYSIIAWSGICTKAYHWGNSINMATLYNQISYHNSASYEVSFDADVVVVNLGTNEASYISTPEGNAYAGQFPTDYRAFLETVRANNPNAYIICLYGMMGKTSIVDSSIRSAVETLGDAKIVYNPFSIYADLAGANGHPSATAHKSYSEALVEYIKTLAVQDRIESVSK